jgi:hypothetical protein
MSLPDTRVSRRRRTWGSLALLALIVLGVYLTARVLTAMGDQVPPPREPLQTSSPYTLPVG